MNPFDFVNAINFTKQDIITNSENPELAEKSYNSFLVNRALSYFPDTVLYANEMNIHHQLDNKPQFHFLLNSIRKNKRFSKWYKQEEDEVLVSICNFYRCNLQKGKDILKVLTSTQLEHLKQEMKKGGTKP